MEIGLVLGVLGVVLTVIFAFDRVRQRLGMKACEEPITQGAPNRGQIEEWILSSNPRQDWSVQSTNTKQTTTFTRDVNLRFEMNFTEEGTQQEDDLNTEPYGVVEERLAAVRSRRRARDPQHYTERDRNRQRLYNLSWRMLSRTGRAS